MSTAVRLIMKEWKAFEYNAPDYIFAGPMKNDIFHWHAIIIGPPDTPFADGIFNLDIIYSYEHPFKPPKCTMKTKMFHPNISSTGKISISILEDDWRPVFTIEKILLSISSILDTPIMDHPINRKAARCFRENRNTYNSIVRKYTSKYANGSSTDSDNEQDLLPEMLHTDTDSENEQDLPPEILHTETNNSLFDFLCFILIFLGILDLILDFYTFFK
ncbi:unnamed protein product [Adineta steineri]|uniref:UBC core domain-containing protein n=1 Tax=Adineta steineri TaxID=433720 RepID=A0A816E9I5_9BILA|nr:unnamed protein product [Adineta steineri]CAF1646004.1 unnamed protein product [Adineta steineri]